MRQALWITISLSLLAGISCSSSSSSGGASTCSGADASCGDAGSASCAETASALCGVIEACAPAFLSVQWVDQATCVERATASCTRTLAAPHTGATPAALSACAGDLRAADCATVLPHDPPASCHPTGGTVATGAACADDWQCQSGYCSVADDQVCGSCAARKAAGDACTDDQQCGYALVCAGPDTGKACVTPSAAGGSCDANHPCTSPYVCTGVTATAAGSCTMAAPAGGACGTSMGCDLAQGLFCNRTTNTCQKLVFAQPGEPCGSVNNGLTLCSGSTCRVPNGQTVLTGMGTCGAIAEDGAACDATAGPTCRAGAKCVAGTCRVPDASTCM